MGSEKYIFYIDMGSGVIPVKCSSVTTDTLKEGNILLGGITSVKDNNHPDLVIHTMSVSKDTIQYYIVGRENGDKKEDASPEAVHQESGIWHWK